jgi:hypothetical protein
VVEDRGGAVEAGRSAVGSGLLLVARLVMLVAYVLAGVIVAAILLFVLGANPDNSIVEAVHDAGSALAGPFKDMFEIERAKVAMTVNWGLGALAYLVVGAIVAGILRNLAPRTYV